MERLTERRNGKAGFAGNSTPTENMCKVPFVLDRLAAYEETGMEPEDVPTGLELAEYTSAIRLLKQYEALGTIDDLTALVKARDEAETALKGAVDNEAN